MKLAKFFEIQQVLDNHILDEHNELKGQDNLDWKILALQVELGECANEWRGFKKWSKDQEPRTLVLVPYCHPPKYKNKLLEEYVDCFHFILSIGLESSEEWLIDENYTIGGFEKEGWNVENKIEQFQVIFNKISDLSISNDADDFIDLVSEFLGLGEMLGFSWEQIEQAYFEKNAVNHQRQESGY
jgi:dimeric dUTPase (all-alpha-NTP-PPase superfamily)